MAFSMNAGRKTAMSEINVTPLVDVMLVLLIIFMVTAPMMQEGINVDLPPATGAPLAKDQHQEDVVISVPDPDKILINESPIQADKLAEKILDALKDRPARDVYLRAGGNVPYGRVIEIMDTLKAAGVSNLGMITAPKEGPAPKK